jgi:predicted component of type VI protein secretion system
MPRPRFGPSGTGERPSFDLWDDEVAAPALPDEPLGRLVIIGGPQTGQSFPVGASPVSIGSGYRCLIRLSEQVDDEERISAEHARVWIRDGHLMVHELRRLTATGSVGGRWEFLEHGDDFTVGPYVVRFELDGAPIAPAPERVPAAAGVAASPPPAPAAPASFSETPAAPPPAAWSAPSPAPQPSQPSVAPRPPRPDDVPDILRSPAEKAQQDASGPSVDTPSLMDNDELWPPSPAVQ